MILYYCKAKYKEVAKLTELKRRRVEKNLTQEQLAAIIGVGQSAIANWETGMRKPDVITLIQLAKALDCTADDLLVDIKEKEV